MVNLVADVGNTRIKWGWCAPDGLAVVAALPPDDPAAWEETLATWEQLGPRSWTLAGVHPARCDRLAQWLLQRGEAVRVLTDPCDLPLAVKVPAPERVGIDRLLDAVAANTRRRPGVPAVVVDAGSA